MNQYFENNNYFSEILSIFGRFLGKFLRRSLIAYISVQDKARKLKFLQELNKTHKSYLSSFWMNLINIFKIIATLVKFHRFLSVFREIF